MKNRYLLYIDILGFSNLVKSNTPVVDDLYEAIASLNVHNHDVFKAIVFSDTILIYNRSDALSKYDQEYLVMFLCEFAQDLQHRLVEKNIFFRAVLVNGGFNHYELNGIPCFYGSALIDAYNSEKEIKAIGLFIQKDVNIHNNVFETATYNDNFEYVFITQSLQRVEKDFQGCFPEDAWLLEDTDEIWHIVPEVLFLQALHQNVKSSLPTDVVKKYSNTIPFYNKQYPKTVSFLLKNNFDITQMSPSANWQQVKKRYPANFKSAIKNRKVF